MPAGLLRWFCRSNIFRWRCGKASPLQRWYGLHEWFSTIILIYIMFHLRKDSVSYILAHPKITSGPTLGAKNVTQYYINTVPQVYWGGPDIWLSQVSYGSEVYPMSLIWGYSARYDEMKQRTSFLIAFIILQYISICTAW